MTTPENAPENNDEARAKRRRRFWLLTGALFLLVAAVTAGVTALLINISSTSRRLGIPSIAWSS